MASTKTTITSHGIHYHFLHSPPKKPLHFHLPFSSLKPSFTSPPIFSTSTLKTPPSTPHHFHFYPSFLPPLSATHRGNSVISPPKDSTFEEHQQQPLKTLLWVVFWASVSLAVYAFSSDSKASAAVAAAVSVSGDSSIKASSFGLRVAAALRGLGWSDEAVVVCVAALPVLELRGAIPVGYWMQLNPLILTLLAVFGNMLPVPFIILYLKKLATFIAGKSRTLSKLLDMLFERAKNKAGPIEEFQWLGLMLFVAVPFPGTGAWTGAIIASVLDMPFWPAVSANFFGVVLAGLLVNLLVNLGLKYAVITGVVLFFVSTFMWSVLRSLRKPLTSTK